MSSAARRRRRGRGRSGLQLQIRRRVRGWAPSARELTRWASTALGPRGVGRELGVAVVGAPESRRLNARYRGRDAATNVLSFAAPPPPRGVPVENLGDLIICARVLKAEARAQAKTLRAHWAHLVVHGALHLIGYDHARAPEARRMERREISVLRRLGFANPYRSA
jgi:probable rRNA maturation factor